MFPVLFSIGKFAVSSYGVFLALGFLLGIFLVWRLGRAWDLDEEKTLDLTLLTFLGGLIGARAYFILDHLQEFANSLQDIVLINKAPGLSFWGGVLGGWLTLFFLAKRFRMNFWQLADIASVGLLGGLIMSDLGCFFGGCSVGAPSKYFFAVTMVGSIGRRWPIQVAEALLLTLSLLKIWSMATHFHQRGKIASLSFILIGIIKLILEPFRRDHSGILFSIAFILLGMTIFYRITKQNPIINLKNSLQSIGAFFTDPKSRKLALQNFGKSWYNQKTAIAWKIRNLKKMPRRSNAKFS